jgi:N-acetylglutamate synthase-like GNAT family acetyltransferase
VRVSIRAYEPRDLEACRALWRELTQRHRDIYEDQAIGGEDPGPAFDEHARRSDLAGLWVAELDGRVVGLTGLTVEGDHGEVEPVVVTLALRSKGIGTRLIETAKEDAMRRGVRYLSIRPAARNIEALSLFRSLGFDVVRGIDLLMELTAEARISRRAGLSIHGQDFRY